MKVFQRFHFDLIAFYLIFYTILQFAECLKRSDIGYCCAPGVNPSVRTDGLTLVQVQVITRHGDRTPVNVLPGNVNNTNYNPIPIIWNCSLSSLNFPTESSSTIQSSPTRLFKKTYLSGRNHLLGNCAWGQLTSVGLKQHVQLGSQYRDLYISKYKLLPEIFNVDDGYVLFRSSDVPRTLQSFMGNFAGLYPESKSSSVVSALDFIRSDSTALIEVHSMDEYYENLWSPNYDLCPKLKEIENQLKSTSDWLQYQNKVRPLITQLQEIFNTTEDIEFGALLDVLRCRQCHNYPLPNGITTELVEQIVDSATWEYYYLYTNNDYGLLGMGSLVDELYNRIQERIAGRIDRPKFFFYSGHDSSVGPLMATFGTFDGVWPPYASHIELELWSDAQASFYFQVKYNGRTMTLPGCSQPMCPWQEADSFLKSRIPSNFHGRCNEVNSSRALALFSLGTTS